MCSLLLHFLTEVGELCSCLKKILHKIMLGTQISNCILQVITVEKNVFCTRNRLFITAFIFYSFSEKNKFTIRIYKKSFNFCTN